jgi:hypothetical protein
MPISMTIIEGGGRVNSQNVLHIKGSSENQQGSTQYWYNKML